MNELAINNVLVRNELNLIELENKFFEMMDLKKTTFDTYKVCLKSFFTWLQDNNIVCPSALDIFNYKKHLQVTVKSATVNLYLSGVKKFFSWLEISGFYPNVAREIKGEKFSKYGKKDALNQEQIKALLNTCDTSKAKGLRDKAIISLMASCGLRDIEVSRLEKDDFFMVDGNWFALIHGKGRSEKDERVFIPDNVYTMIQQYLKEKKCTSSYVFSSESNNCKGGMTVQAISGVVKSALRAIGLDSERLTAHSLRTSAVTNLLKNNVDVLEVQEFARHQHLNTTMIYNRMVKGNKIKVACGNILSNGLI